MASKADPLAKPVVAKDGPSIALIDGKRGPGPLAVPMACDVAIEKAKATGTAIVGVNHSHDAFQAGLYAEHIACQDLVGMIFSDDNVPVGHPQLEKGARCRRDPHAGRGELCTPPSLA